MKGLFCGLILASLLGVPPKGALATGNSEQRNQTQEAHRERLNDVYFGEAVYSLYVDEPLTALGRMAVAKRKGVDDAQLQTIALLEGGVQLGYGMPKSAQENLAKQASSLLENNRPLAWYWLARLNFSHQRVSEGLKAYRAFSNAVASADADKYDLITPEQWFELNYEAAQGVLSIRNSDIATFMDAIPQEHITRHYLQYNRAIDAYQTGNLLEAHHILEALKRALGEKSDAALNNSGWMSWFDWRQARGFNNNEQREVQALLNQVLFAEGQILLNLERRDEALQAFSNINTNALAQKTEVNTEGSPDTQRTFFENGQVLLRDEALLHYGWGLAQSNNWPLALGVWDYLAAQPTNLFTLQATHALAYGYAQEGGEIQAYNTLERLVSQLEDGVNQLDRLTQKVSEDGYWKAVAVGAKNLSREIDANKRRAATKEINWETLWPLSHHDLLADIIVNNEGGEQDKLEQLLVLYNVERELTLQLADAEIYANLLEERDRTHLSRSQSTHASDTQAHLNSLAATFHELKKRVQINGQLHSTRDDEWLRALLTFASAQQLQWYTRLERSEARLTRLAKERKMRPSYRKRLERLTGILIWQLTEQYPKAHWQSQRALQDVETLLNQATEAQQNFDVLLNKPSVTETQRERVASVKARIEKHLNATRGLIVAIEDSLTLTSHNVIAQRKAYLEQQSAQSKLAMLQLRDINVDAPSPSSRSNKAGKDQ